MEIQLIIKKITNQLTPQEEVQFDLWYRESPEHRAFYRKAIQNYQCQISADPEEAFRKLSLEERTRSKRKPYLSYAVAAILVLALASTFFLNYNRDVTVPAIAMESVKEKKNEILLTLENGKQISLISQDSVQVLDNMQQRGNQLVYSQAGLQPISQNILSIPRGEIFEIHLADGSRVWLNSDTKLRYPVKFEDNAPRIVELVYGEAFFEVSPSRTSENNFVVKTRSQKITVLGTEFNVKAYRDDTTIETVLAEGKVVLNDTLSQKSNALQPGYKSIGGQGTDWEIVKADVESEISWREGTFIFKEKELREIMRVVERWYDVEIFFEDPAAGATTFNGVFRKNQDLKNILSLLNQTGEVEYEFDQKAIKIK